MTVHSTDTSATDFGESDVEDQLQAIPERTRTTRVGGQFWIWAGANLAPINWVLGALGINLGLGVRDTIIVIVLGNLVGMSLFGLFVLLGQKTGATGMVLARAAFGRRGDYLPAAIQAAVTIGWCAINTYVILDLVLALFGKIGWLDPADHNYGWKIGTAAFLMASQVLIAWFGYRAIAAFERWTVPPTIVILIAMSLFAWFGMDIDWGYAGPPGQILHGWERIAVMSSVMTVIGIGWGITWFTYAADYSRFVSKSVPKRKLYFVSTMGQFLPVVWLGVLGASLATKSQSVDPGKLVVDNFGALAIPVLLLVIHGPIATNILNIYTFSVASQALDIKVKRNVLNLFVGIFSFIAVIFFIYQEDLAAVLDSFLSSLVAWVASWGGLMLVHYYWLNRIRPISADRLFDPIGSKRLPDINWAGVCALIGGIFATWLFMAQSLEVLQSPLVTAMGGLDLSWLAGLTVSATIYAIFGPRTHFRYAAKLSAETARAETAPDAPAPTLIKEKP
ncbi:purine-cytosine permease family protein [Brevibacterium zhoupengii]|uniref:purine-cytosine permease family protein n=1 Tax=Brevibacterium zhoupengii TaxID=2898795 RepID=UPI001E2EAB1B|nr:cytosine permease [Brevibacterium zhoupengii]